MRISDCSSDVCSSDLHHGALCWALLPPHRRPSSPRRPRPKLCAESSKPGTTNPSSSGAPSQGEATPRSATTLLNIFYSALSEDSPPVGVACSTKPEPCSRRSDEHTSELQSLTRIPHADFCLIKK